MSQKYLDTVARFLAKVERITESGCWIWMASTSAGYGQFKMNGRMEKAHRASYTLFKGEIPLGKILLHICDVTQCVSPAHLMIGTHKDNLDDMHRKGRQHYPGAPAGALAGEKNGRAKLTAEQAAEIRSSAKSTRMLAREYGVSRANIQFIKHGRSWRLAQ